MVGIERKDDQLSVFVAQGELTQDELVEAYADFLKTRPTPYSTRPVGPHLGDLDRNER